MPVSSPPISAPPVDAMDIRYWKARFNQQNSIAFRLAWRNITRDRVRFLIAVIGVGFAVLLMTVQLGLLIGFATTSSSLIDRATADFWVVPRGGKDVDQAGQIVERQKYTALGVPDVDSVRSLVVRFAEWKTPNGGTQSVIVVGIDPSEPALEPWSFVVGSTASLHVADAVIIDELYAEKLGVSYVGQTVEVGNQRVRVVGITSTIRTFTQSPYAFASLKNAKILTGLPDDRTTYLLVRARPGADLRRMQRDLETALPSADIWTSSGFSWQTRFYWLVSTGAGTAVLIAAMLGLIVGLVIVSQTLYSATIERVEEYATIRAIGAASRYLKAIILRQALLSGAIGFVIGTAAAIAAAWLARRSSAAMAISSPLILVLAVVTLGMCVAASLISIRKVLTIDAASVFR
jgi:putative ABC transport system permease protein